MSKKLTKDLIVQKIRSDRLGSIKNLNLWGANLDDVSLIQEMPSLEIVSLSINSIRSLKAFSGLPYLRELYLRKNMIADLNEIKYLTDCDNLRILWLSENPICDNPNYRNIVISVLPQLAKLDDIMITDEERNKADKILLQNNNISDYEDDEQMDNYENDDKYNNNNYNNKNNYNNNNFRNNNNNSNNYNKNNNNNSNNYNNNNYNDENIHRGNKRRISEEKYNKNIKDKYNKIYDDDYDRNYNEDLSQSHQIKRTPTYQQKNLNEDMRREENNYKEGFKRHQSSNMIKGNYYKNDEMFNDNSNKFRDRDFNDYNDYNDYNYKKNNNNRNGNKSNILNCVLLLLKELNRNELNIVKREIDRENNN